MTLCNYASNAKSYVHKVKEKLMEMGFPTRHRTAFEKAPCYMCKNFDPWHGDGHGMKFEDWGIHPCDHRLNFCLKYHDNMCKRYDEAGKTFWSAERWRIENIPNYVFMNHNLFRHSKPLQSMGETQT